MLTPKLNFFEIVGTMCSFRAVCHFESWQCPTIPLTLCYFANTKWEYLKLHQPLPPNCVCSQNKTKQIKTANGSLQICTLVKNKCSALWL